MASGHVWTLLSPDGAKPGNGLTVVSMLHLAEGTQFRMVGADVSHDADARIAQPGLEDGCVWLMKSAGESIV